MGNGALPHGPSYRAQPRLYLNGGRFGSALCPLSEVLRTLKIGPSLAGVFGRKSGTEAGFDYSPALKAAAITWDDMALDKFLQNPGADVHGTKMVVSVPGNDDRQNVIAYLKTLKP